MLTKKDGTQVEIKLGRYDFDTTTGETKAVPSDFSEDTSINHNNSYGNMIAKDIDGFKKSVKENGGYYIARYEAGIENGSLNIEDMKDEWNAPNVDWTGYTGENMKLVLKSGATVWSYITQNKAANLCRSLTDANGYEGITSDLMNSYARDTAIVYIQECGTDSNYANQIGLSTTADYPSKTGKAVLAEGKGKGKNDVQCNIYDMAGNCCEWTTETYGLSDYPCVSYGGGYDDNNGYTSFRHYRYNTTTSRIYISFRPLLYL